MDRWDISPARFDNSQSACYAKSADEQCHEGVERCDGARDYGASI